MKKHLLATLCVGSLLALPGCMGCCQREEKTETSASVDAANVSVTPETGAQPMDATPAEASATPAEETNKF